MAEDPGGGAAQLLGPRYDAVNGLLESSDNSLSVQLFNVGNTNGPFPPVARFEAIMPFRPRLEGVIARVGLCRQHGRTDGPQRGRPQSPMSGICTQQVLCHPEAERGPGGVG